MRKAALRDRIGPGSADLVSRLAWQAGIAWRASRIGAIAAFVVGSLLRMIVPVDDLWLAAVVAAGCALAALALAALEARTARPDAPPTVADGTVALESMGAAGQVAQALGRSAVLLAAFALGLWTGDAMGLGRA